MIKYTLSRTNSKSSKKSKVSSPFGSRNTLNLSNSINSIKKSKSLDMLLPFLIQEAHSARVNRPVVKNRKKQRKTLKQLVTRKK